MTRTPRSFVAVFIVLFSFSAVAQPPPPPADGWFEGLFKDNAPLITAFVTGAAVAAGIVWFVMRQNRRPEAPQASAAVQAVVAGVAALAHNVELGGGSAERMVVLPGLARVERIDTRTLDAGRIQDLKMLMLELRGVPTEETRDKVLRAMRDMTYEELDEVAKIFEGFWDEVHTPARSPQVQEAPSAVAQTWQDQKLARQKSNALNPAVRRGSQAEVQRVDYSKVRGSLRELRETPITILCRLVKDYAATQELTDIRQAAKAVVSQLKELSVDEVREAAREPWFWTSMLAAHNGGGSIFFSALTPEQFAAAMEAFVVKLRPLPQDASIDDMRATMRFAAFRLGTTTPYMEALCVRLMQRIGKQPQEADASLAIFPEAEEIVPYGQLVQVKDLKALWLEVFGSRAVDMFHCYNKLPATFLKIMDPYFAELVRIDPRLTVDNFQALMAELKSAYLVRQKRARDLIRECAEPMLKRIMALECAKKTAPGLHEEQGTSAWFAAKSKEIADGIEKFLASIEDPRVRFIFQEGEQAMVLELNAALARRTATQNGLLAIEQSGPTIEFFEDEDEEGDKKVLLLE